MWEGRTTAHGSAHILTENTSKYWVRRRTGAVNPFLTNATDGRYGSGRNVFIRSPLF